MGFGEKEDAFGLRVEHLQGQGDLLILQKHRTYSVDDGQSLETREGTRRSVLREVVGEGARRRLNLAVVTTVSLKACE